MYCYIKFTLFEKLLEKTQVNLLYCNVDEKSVVGRK